LFSFENSILAVHSYEYLVVFYASLKISWRI